MYDITPESIKNETILAFLGGSATKRLLDDIDRLKCTLVATVHPRHTAAKFSLKKTDLGVVISSADLLLTGESITQLLQHSDECFLMAATLGADADRLIMRVQRESISDGVILDAIASAAIETVCDNIQDKLSAEYQLTMRYSPGYGDFPLEVQPEILRLLNAQKMLGLFCNQSNILIPRKSVTAVLGVCADILEVDLDKCDKCLLKATCNIRKDGKRCGR